MPCYGESHSESDEIAMEPITDFIFANGDVYVLIGDKLESYDWYRKTLYSSYYYDDGYHTVTGID